MKSMRTGLSLRRTLLPVALAIVWTGQADRCTDAIAAAPLESVFDVNRPAFVRGGRSYSAFYNYVIGPARIL